jgi:hypothetical protein
VVLNERPKSIAIPAPGQGQDGCSVAGLHLGT